MGKYHTMESYSSINKKEKTSIPATWMTLRCIIPSEKEPFSKVTTVFHFYDILTWQIYRDSKHIRSYQSPGSGERLTTKGHRTILRDDRMSYLDYGGDYKNVNIYQTSQTLH